ncbi:MAG: glycosyltransferase [Candidatus Gastranaerophilales bacterium]|nr:glycosyltransferase [Candidatus Gastranaerophilales bacterium]
MPKISVIMTVYNTKEEYLREAVESILNQTYKDFEFIIINDGSINNAKDVILSYDDKRIKYFENEKNIGLVKSSNKGLDIAQGEYIARMDSDDISMPERFEKQIKFMEENPEITVLGTYFKILPTNETVKPPTKNDEIVEHLLYVNSAFAHPSVMLKKSLLDKYSARYNENYQYAQDYGLWLSLINKAVFANLDEVLLYYRVHGLSVSQLYNHIQLKIANLMRLQAQGKILGINAAEIIDIEEKIEEKEKLSTKEFLTYINYLDFQMGKMKTYDPIYFKHLYKHAAKLCPKNLEFLKILLTHPVTKKLKVHIFFKIHVLQGK